MASRPECPTCEERSCKEWDRCAERKDKPLNRIYPIAGNEIDSLYTGLKDLWVRSESPLTGFYVDPAGRVTPVATLRNGIGFLSITSNVDPSVMIELYETTHGYWRATYDEVTALLKAIPVPQKTPVQDWKKIPEVVPNWPVFMQSVFSFIGSGEPEALLEEIQGEEILNTTDISIESSIYISISMNGDIHYHVSEPVLKDGGWESDGPYTEDMGCVMEPIEKSLVPMMLFRVSGEDLRKVLR